MRIDTTLAALKTTESLNTCLFSSAQTIEFHSPTLQTELLRPN